MTISASDAYFKALCELDRDAYLSCFNSAAELRDPYGGEPFLGHDGIAKWFKGMERTWQEFSIKPVDQFRGGDRIAVQWEAQGRAKSGKNAQFSGINVFTFDNEGLISHLEGYWDFQSMVAQIS
jgi:ketosteroid isomerase-like protein